MSILLFALYFVSATSPGIICNLRLDSSWTILLNVGVNEEMLGGWKGASIMIDCESDDDATDAPTAKPSAASALLRKRRAEASFPFAAIS
jgi:hypothetical protein